MIYGFGDSVGAFYGSSCLVHVAGSQLRVGQVHRGWEMGQDYLLDGGKDKAKLSNAMYK